MSSFEFNQLLLNNSAFLKPFALTLTRDYENAKDLIQETLFKALNNKDKYHVGTNIRAWLTTIMRNIFINDYRRQMKQQKVLDIAANEFLLDSKQVHVANEAISTLGHKEMQMAVHQLPSIFKTPFLLYFDGYRYHEIAEMVQEPLGTIKSRIHFARKLLKQEMANN
jgi:RNA polymerase sigma factor (sigma-70 family)